jgi:hypothetical protein
MGCDVMLARSVLFQILHFVQDDASSRVILSKAKNLNHAGAIFFLTAPG